MDLRLNFVEARFQLSNTQEAVDMSARQANPPILSENMERRRIPVSQPMLDGREHEYVMEALASGWLTSQGRFVTAFERAFAEYCGVRHAVAVCSAVSVTAQRDPDPLSAAHGQAS